MYQSRIGHTTSMEQAVFTVLSLDSFFAIFHSTFSQSRTLQNHPMIVTAVHRSYDTNGDGSIDCAELGAALSRMGLHPSERQVRCMMELLDTDQSGAVSYKEFRRFACMLPRTQVSAPQ